MSCFELKNEISDKILSKFQKVDILTQRNVSLNSRNLQTKIYLLDNLTKFGVYKVTYDLALARNKQSANKMYTIQRTVVSVSKAHDDTDKGLTQHFYSCRENSH